MQETQTILVVDSHPEIRAELEAALVGAGFAAVGLATSEAALDFLEHTLPALVLVEAELPGTSGLEILARLRSRPETRDLPVILLTSARSSSQITEAFETGADDFLRKPVRAPELLARIGAHLRLHEYVKELARKERDAQVMLELTQALSSSLDFRDILYTVVRRIAEVMEVARVSFVLAPESQTEDVGYVIAASDDEQLSNLKLDLTKYPEIQQVLRTRKPLTIRDASTHPLLEVVREDVQNVALGSMSLFPIVWEDQVIGVLFLRAHPGRNAFSEREVHFCQIVANATAAALRNARVLQSLRDHTQQITFARFEAERRLRSLKRYADLFASAAEGIAVIEASGRMLFANPRAYEIVGYTEETLRGRKLRELVHPDDMQRARELWVGFSRGEFPRGTDLRVVCADDRTIVVNCSFASLLDGEGAVLISIRDVSDERMTAAELRKTKEFLESLFNASVDAIVAADMKGTIVLFNQGAERIYGRDASEVIGSLNVRALYPGDGAREVMKKLRSPQHGGVGKLSPIRTDVLSATGEIIPVSLSAAVIYENGEPSATFGIFTDLREKLRVEERLVQAQQKLAITEKQALIAELAGTTAHELNQPLTSIMAYAELLRRKLDPKSAEYRAAETMTRESERMAEIVRKIGKMTKYETKSYVGGQNILDLDKASAQEPDGAPEKR